jgi:hypothetical protein
MTMSEPTPASPREGGAVPEQLHELARRLREARHLRPGLQKNLADLLDEMAGELATAPASPQSEHLLESAATLARELHEERLGGPLEAAKERLTEAATRAERKAPVATGLALRLVDLLSEMGI